VLLVWLFLTCLTSLPYARAAFDPPPGRVFVGTFHWIDDFYNYVAFAQQAEDGFWVFRNKLVPEDHPAVLVNLEWLLVGRLSALLGRRPFLAYRILAAAACLGLVLLIDRWGRAGGLPNTHRLPALLLVTTGGGLGGLIFELTELPISRSVDLSVGLYPFIGLLSNPHWIVSHALLLWALWAFMTAEGPRSHALAIALGTVIGLVRPYDLALLGGIRVLAVVMTEPWYRWHRRLLPLLGLVPVLAYGFWAFFANPSFSGVSNPRYAEAFPHRIDFLYALGPALALAGMGLYWRRRGEPLTRAVKAHLWAWSLLGVTFILARPVTFSLQFAVGLGLPLLALGALGLGRFRPQATLLACVLMSSMALVAVRIVLRPDPHWFTPVSFMKTALALRQPCAPGAVLLAPPDIARFAIGLTSCSTYVAHSAADGYAERFAEMATFYSPGSPRARGATLDRLGITHLVLLGDAGPTPTAWLGPNTPFRRVAVVPGRPTFGVYRRGALRE
jgi:hypothetical protein